MEAPTFFQYLPAITAANESGKCATVCILTWISGGSATFHPGVNQRLTGPTGQFGSWDQNRRGAVSPTG